MNVGFQAQVSRYPFVFEHALGHRRDNWVVPALDFLKTPRKLLVVLVDFRRPLRLVHVGQHTCVRRQWAEAVGVLAMQVPCAVAVHEQRIWICLIGQQRY